MNEAKERVLVVDDSPQNRLVACGHLEAAGYEVVAAASGEEALELLVKQPFELLVLDVMMPGLGGFETCRRVRATPAIAELPILFLTALGDREATAPALEAGGDDLLPKPFNRAELLLRSRALIRQRQTTAELRQAMRMLAEHNEQLRRIEHDRRKMGQLIVHDLRGPITGVSANAQLLRACGLPEELGEIADELVVAAEQLDRTARDLLDLSRAQDGAGSLAPALSQFDVATVANDVVTSLRGAARYTGVTLELVVEPTQVTADRELVRRILQNLVHNALKHAPPQTKVRVDAKLADGALVVRVADDGPGVSRAEAERMFDRVPKLGDANRGAGAGLGLAFCRLAAEAHGGKVSLEEQEAGACFCVRIPQPPPAP